jgi:hypothetical protein
MSAKKNITSHSLAPSGMPIPEQGNAYVIGSAVTVKEPLVESNLEMYHRFQEEKDGTKKKKQKKEVKKLKKDGKVCTLARMCFLNFSHHPNCACAAWKCNGSVMLHSYSMLLIYLIII